MYGGTKRGAVVSELEPLKLVVTEPSQVAKMDGLAHPIS